MALVGSVVTGDMKFNTIYAGTPANLSAKRLGPSLLKEPLMKIADDAKAFEGIGPGNSKN